MQIWAADVAYKLASRSNRFCNSSQTMLKILISACLLGDRVRYNGSDVSYESDLLDQWKAEGRIVPFCPEVAGGFPTPRPAAEIIGRDGLAVIDGSGRVFDTAGQDVTGLFIDGASKALEVARKNGVKLAVLKEESPSCGSTYIYNGDFSGVHKNGQGVATALLERNGVRVFSEKEIEAAARCLAQMEGTEGESFADS